jgi:PAS domain S-box-containing protein
MSSSLPGIDVSLIDSLAVPASLHDVSGHFVHMNGAAERALGSSNVQVRGRHYTEQLPPEARESVEAQFRRAAERGEPTDFETVFVDASGHIRACGRNTCPSGRATPSWASSFSRSTCAGRHRSQSVASRNRDSHRVNAESLT